MLILLFLHGLLFSVYAEGPYVADLKNGLKDLSEFSCWEGGSFNEKSCTRTEKDCAFVSRGKSFRKTSLNFVFSDDAMAAFRKIQSHGSSEAELFTEDAVFNYSSVNRIYLSSSGSTQTKENYPVGAKMTLYVSNASEAKMELIVLKQFTVPENGYISDVIPQYPIHNIRLLLPELKNGSYHGRILNSNFYGPIKNSIDLKLPVGSFPISISYRDGYVFRKLDFTLNVVPDKGNPGLGSNKELHLTALMFLTPDNERPSTENLYWKTDYTTKIQFPELSINSTSLEFKEIKNFTVSGSEKENLSGLFTVQSGKAVIRSEKISEFTEKISRTPFHTMTVSGVCYDVAKNNVFKEIMIFDKPNEKAKFLGLFIVRLPESNKINLSFKDLNGKESKVYVNLMEGSCRDESNPELLHVVREAKDDWVNFGKGPWGSSAWIKVPKKELSQMGEYFDFQGRGWARLTSLGGGKIEVSGTSRSENVTGEESETKFKYQVDESELWSDKGDFIPSTDCSYGC